MKVRTKLILGFLAVALIVVSAGYYSIANLEEASLQSVGADLADYATLVMSDVDRGVRKHIEELDRLAIEAGTMEHVLASNTKFADLPDREAKIQAIDLDWKAGKSTSSIDTILKSELSQSLESMRVRRLKASDPAMFSEIYITNQYGVVIGSSGRTSDYLQADEDWYHSAIQERDFWIGNVGYDRSSLTHSLDIVIPLRDAEGQTLGIIKGVLSIQAVAQDVELATTLTRYPNARVYLIDQAGLAVLERGETISEDVHQDVKLHEFGEDLSREPQVAIALKEQNGFERYTEGDTDRIMVFSRSRGFQDYRGLGWTLVMEFDTQDVLEAVFTAKYNLFLLSSVVAVIGVFSGVMISSSISGRINRLTVAADDIAAGRRSSAIERVTGRDEIAVLTKAFHQMTTQLDLFREFVKASGQGYGVATLEGTITYANPTLCRMMGIDSSEDYQGQSLAKYHPDEFRQTMEQEIKPRVMNRGRWFGESSLRSVSGELTPIHLDVFLIYDEEKQPSYLATVITDITERKEAESKLRSEEKLLRELLEIQEQERRMVAHDIHDGFVQDVVGAKMHVEVIRSLLADDEPSGDGMKDDGLEDDGDPEIPRTPWDQVALLLEKALAEGRRMIRNLRPLVLDDVGVIQAVEHLIAETLATHDLTISFQHEVQFERLDPKLEGAIFRIVQEALNNVRQHADTNFAAIQLQQQKDLLCLIIRDQGAGFNPAEIPSDHFGLRGIQERARLFGGEAVIESVLGEGTVIRVTLPVQFQHEAYEYVRPLNNSPESI